tara:strand:+ start:2151 stop:2369 length:219 start_codon:yes stop_codon:yes gene_type:complete
MIKLKRLKKDFGYPCDYEYTFENGDKLPIVVQRNKGKRTFFMTLPAHSEQSFSRLRDLRQAIHDFISEEFYT